MSPPFSAGPPSQSVIMPPAASMIGIERDDVVGLQADLDDEVDMAGGHHRIGVAIGAVARQPHDRLEPVVGFAPPALEQRGRRGAERRVGKRGGLARRQRRALPPGPSYQAPPPVA